MQTTSIWPVLVGVALGATSCGSDSEANVPADSGSTSNGGSSAAGGTETGGGGGASEGGAGASTGGASNGGASGGASNGGASGSASGGASNGGAASTGGRPGAGDAGSGCPPECLVANACVTACGESPTNYGCCPCPADHLDARSCGNETDGVSCDQREIRCRALEPPCEAGMVPSIQGTCWGPCVPIDWCLCEGPDFCPKEETYTCHNSAGRCGPYL